MNDVIKILESLEKSGLLIDWAVKLETKKQEGGLLCTIMAPMAAWLIAPTNS